MSKGLKTSAPDFTAVLARANEQNKILLVARDTNGREVNRQWCPNLETANRLMVARNRPGRMSRTELFPTWGIEEEV